MKTLREILLIIFPLFSVFLMLNGKMLEAIFILCLTILTFLYKLEGLMIASIGVSINLTMESSMVQSIIQDYLEENHYKLVKEEE